MLTTKQLVAIINEDSKLDNIRVQHNMEQGTLIIFEVNAVWAFMKVRVYLEKLDIEFLGAVPDDVTANQLKKVFEYLTEYEKTPLADRDEKYPIQYNGMYIADLVAEHRQPSGWSSSWAVLESELTLSFYLVSEEYKAHRYSKRERNMFDQYVKDLYEKGARVEITG